MLSGHDVDGVIPDGLQGGQWAAVFALDPLTGVEGPAVHAMSPGRLCVMASRHYAHLTWVQDGAWRKVPIGMAANQADTSPVLVHRAESVRRALTT